jgi:type VI secretion system secreted protein VgrG
MATYTQKRRPMQVTTPLGADKLLLVGLSGQEGLSQLFQFHLDMIAENETEVAFDKLLGQKVSVEVTLEEGGKRHFSGIVSRLSQGERDTMFTKYRMEVVPQFWLLTRKVQSRIFQHKNVPDILKELLKGLDVEYQLQGPFHPRDFCVQYRESDFSFASRVMEEEGIYYFFKHTESGHTLVLANTPQGHPDVPGPSQVIYEEVQGGSRVDGRVFHWEKVQELRSGKYTLWDHSFEKPSSHLDAEKTIQDSVSVGQVNHKLKVGGNDQLEIYDYPGEYAQRFDGIDRGGGEQPSEIEKIFEDNARTVGIRMQQEAVPSLVVRGSGACPQFVSGHKFTLERHFNADGPYVLTGVQHSASLSGDYRSGQSGACQYMNSFVCIPAGIPYRPLITTPKPTIHGTQTAVVVGPAGEEIFTDKYGRVKVQFRWDRQGKNDGDSSCWVRVGTPWAGKQWGIIHIPRIGQEVMVAFEEGDPDQPIIVGSVYNAEQMPPYTLPDNKTQSGVKSRSSLEGTPDNFNEIRFEDKKGEEQLYIHAEKNQDIEVENDETHWVGNDRKKTIDRDERVHVKRDRTETVDKNEKITIGVNRTEQVGGNEFIAVSKNRTRQVANDETITIDGKYTRTVAKETELTVGKDRSQTIGGNDQLTVGKELLVTVADMITLQTGAASIVMKKNGDIQIKGKNITITGSGKIIAKASSDVVLKGSQIKSN